LVGKWWILRLVIDWSMLCDLLKLINCSCGIAHKRINWWAFWEGQLDCKRRLTGATTSFIGVKIVQIVQIVLGCRYEMGVAVNFYFWFDNKNVNKQSATKQPTFASNTVAENKWELACRSWASVRVSTKQVRIQFLTLPRSPSPLASFHKSKLPITRIDAHSYTVCRSLLTPKNNCTSCTLMGLNGYKNWVLTCLGDCHLSHVIIKETPHYFG